MSASNWAERILQEVKHEPQEPEAFAPELGVRKRGPDGDGDSLETPSESLETLFEALEMPPWDHLMNEVDNFRRTQEPSSEEEQSDE